MRTGRSRRPRWKLLHLILLAMVGALVLEHRLHLTSAGHKVTLVLLILAAYGLMGLWVHSNGVALQDLDDDEYRKRRRDPAIYGTPESPTPTQSRFREAVSFYHHESPDK